MKSLWRVNSTYLLGAILLGWVMIDRLPYRKFVGAVLLTIYPLFATVMLTGGGFRFVTIQRWSEYYTWARADFFWPCWKMGWITGPLLDLSKVAGVAGWFFIFFAAALVSVGVDFDLSKVDTRDWGGLLITLVVATTAIVVSLPLGILLALGRRSNLPVARTLSIIFIEFWRGVPS